MFSRFIQNAGAKNSFRCLAVLLVLGFALAKDFRTGLGMATLPVVVLGFFSPLAIRDWLIARFEVVRMVLNVFAVVCIVAVMAVPKPQGEEPAALRVAIAAVFSLYMGAYFWVLSDERIRRV